MGNIKVIFFQDRELTPLRGQGGKHLLPEKILQPEIICFSF
jgi:hypothetical protein